MKAGLTSGVKARMYIILYFADSVRMTISVSSSVQDRKAVTKGQASTVGNTEHTKPDKHNNTNTSVNQDGVRVSARKSTPMSMPGMVIKIYDIVRNNRATLSFTSDLYLGRSTLHQ